MSLINDLVQGVVDGVLKDILKKPSSTSKRTRRRKRTTSSSSATLRQIEKLLRPAKKQTSRKRTVRSRSKARRTAKGDARRQKGHISGFRVDAALGMLDCCNHIVPDASSLTNIAGPPARSEV